MMLVNRFIFIASALVILGCVRTSPDAWYQSSQPELVAGQNKTSKILSNTSPGEFRFEGTVLEVIEQLNKHLKEQGIDNFSVFLDLDLVKEFSPNPDAEISELLSQELSGSVEYENLYLLFSRVTKGSGFIVQSIKSHIVLTPKKYSKLYLNANRSFDAFTFSDGYLNFYSMISYINLMIPDEELVVDISSCPIIADHKVDPSQIAEMTFLDAIRIARDRLSANVTLEEKNRLIFRCSQAE